MVAARCFCSRNQHVAVPTLQRKSHLLTRGRYARAASRAVRTKAGGGVARGRLLKHNRKSQFSAWRSSLGFCGYQVARPPRLAGDGTLSNSVVGHHATVHASTHTRRRWSSVAGRNHDSRELIESMPRLFRSFGLIWLLKKHLGPHKSGFIFLFLSCTSRITKGRGGILPSLSAPHSCRFLLPHGAI